MPLKIGMRVLAKGLGEATVTKFTRNEVIVKLISPKGIKIRIPVEEVEPLEAVAVSQAEIDERPPVLPDRNIKALRALEALRFGVASDIYIEKTTVGYESFKEWFTPRLPHNSAHRPQVYEISGPFGVGKSHTIAVMRHIALASGYLCARIEADARTLSLAYPERLLYSLWLNLEGPDFQPEYPLLELYLKVMQKGYDRIPPILKENDLFRENFAFIADLKRMDLLDKYGYMIDEALIGGDTVTTGGIKKEIGSEIGISRNKILFRPLKGRTNEQKAELFIASLVGHSLLITAAGYRGLLLTIDEFEAHSVISTVMKEKAERVIYNIMEYINEKTDLPPAALGLCFASIDQGKGEGDEMLDGLIAGCTGHRYILKNWSREQQVEMSRQIYSIYQEAYSITDDFDAGLIEKVDEILDDRGFGDMGRVRGFIKFYLALLDMRYGPGRGKC